MCFFHMKCAIEKRMLMLKDKILEIEILTDIFWIQKVQSKDILDVAINLFNQKYNKNKNKEMTDFLMYFNDYWYDRLI
jgi:hypothetical protein